MDQLQAAGFVKPSVKIPRRLILSLSGLNKTGKTHFALTAAEVAPPVAFINLNIGTEGVIQKFVQRGLDVRELKIEAGSKLVAAEATSKVLVDTYNKFLKSFKIALQHAKTIIIDTESEAWELCRAARFGKLLQVSPHLYAPVNLEYAGTLNLAYEHDINLILIHSMKDLYVNDKRTGKMERAGFSKIPYLAQCNAMTTKIEDPEGGPPQYGIKILDCRQNRDVEGLELEGEMSNFGTLLGFVHGG